MTGIDQEQDRLIAAYIRGTADPEAVARLEETMLDDEALFERVQQEALLQRGLKTTLVDSESSSNSRSAFWRWPGLALLGTLGLAVVVLGGWIVQLQQQINHLQAPQTGIPVITLHDQRSLIQQPQAELAMPDPGERVLLEIDVSAHDQRSFSVTLGTGDGLQTWQDLSPDERGYITFLLVQPQNVLDLQVKNEDGEVLMQKRFP